MTRDRAMRALDHGDKVLSVARNYIAQLERQLDKVTRERDTLQQQLKSHRQAMIRRVYTHSEEVR